MSTDACARLAAPRACRPAVAHAGKAAPAPRATVLLGEPLAQRQGRIEVERDDLATVTPGECA